MLRIVTIREKLKLLIFPQLISEPFMGRGQSVAQAYLQQNCLKLNVVVKVKMIGKSFELNLG